MNNHINVELDSQPIELCKLLKVANIVGGGGEAKIVISEGYVLVNGEVEYQKRKKIYHQDIVEFNGDIVEVICHAPITIKTKATEKSFKPDPTKAQTPNKNTQAKPAKKSKPKSSSSALATDPPIASHNKGKRKRISF